jgi:phosphopantetheine adenylyltransferase
VKEVAQFGGDVSNMVPESVRKALQEKLGSGK